MKVIVDAGAWQLAINVLRRDAADGMHVRSEIVEELEKSTVSLSDEWKLVPSEPTKEMVESTFTRAAGESTRRVQRPFRANIYRKMLKSSPLPHNAGGNATERSEGRVDHNVGRRLERSDV